MSKKPAPQHSAIVLAGGRSSRMGQSKAALDFGGTKLLQRIVAELGKRFAEIVIVAAPEGLKDAASLGAKLLHDEVAFAGPLGALARGLDAISHDDAFACSCDLPMLNAEVASAIVATLPGYDAAIPMVGGRLQPLHAAYRKASVAKIHAIVARGESRMSALRDALHTRIVPEDELRPLDAMLLSFFNVNTLDDYRRALKILRRQSTPAD